MATNYAAHVSTRVTPQTEPVIGKSMVKNSAGGYVFELDNWKRLERFLILGQEGPTYYASEQKLVVENAQCVIQCAESDIERTISTIVEISESGRAPKNDPAIFALAMLAGHPVEMIRTAALAVMPRVCRIGTHLFQFVDQVQQFRGWGPQLRKGVAAWYTSKTDEAIAYQCVKYQQRNGISHRDVLRLSHPKMGASQVARYVVGKPNECTVPIIVAFEAAKKATSEDEIVRLITDFNLPRECVPTHFLNSVKVWEALLVKMPLAAMVRNLGKMSSIGLTKPLSKASIHVGDSLRNVTFLKSARLHPMQLLIAQRTYAAGHGDKGSLRWPVDNTILKALDDAFYLSFEAVVPANKRFLLGLDVSGSMAGGSIAGSPLTPREASAAMALVTMKTEPYTHVVGFTGASYAAGKPRTGTNRYGYDTKDGVTQLPLQAGMDLRSAIRTVSDLPFGRTDCALPMLYALEKGLEVDAFVILTDCETYFGNIHPFQALRQYREKTGINAKLIVVGMIANTYSIADSSDGGMLDVIGFDTATPALISDFVRS